MKNILYPFLILFLIFGCEDTDEAMNTSLLGSWNYSVYLLENNCDGTGEVEDMGTLEITDTEFIINETETLSDWCDEDLVNDTLCVEYGDSTSLNDFQEICVNEGGTFDSITGICDNPFASTYTLSDSLYLTFQDTIHIPESYSSICAEEGGVYADGVCTITYNSTHALNLDDVTATLTRTFTENDTLYCEKFVLTK